MPSPPTRANLERDERQFLALLSGVVVVLIAIGTFLGWGLGSTVNWIRNAWPSPGEPLVTNKVAAPDPAPQGGPATACPATSLALAVSAPAGTVVTGSSMTLEVSITNTGRHSCTVAAGDESRQVHLINAADEVVWNSAHCAGRAREILLSPSDTDTQQVHFTARPSTPGRCVEGAGFALPGSFYLQVVLEPVTGALSPRVPLTVAP